MYKDYTNKMIDNKGYDLKHIPKEYRDELNSLNKTDNKVRRFRLIKDLGVLHKFYYYNPSKKDAADSVLNYIQYVKKSI